MTKPESSQSEHGVTTLEPPEVLEPRLAPMWFCCGHWSYSFSFSLAGPGFTATWTEDGPCQDV